MILKISCDSFNSLTWLAHPSIQTARQSEHKRWKRNKEKMIVEKQEDDVSTHVTMENEWERERESKRKQSSITKKREEEEVPEKWTRKLEATVHSLSPILAHVRTVWCAWKGKLRSLNHQHSENDVIFFHSSSIFFVQGKVWGYEEGKKGKLKEREKEEPSNSRSTLYVDSGIHGYTHSHTHTQAYALTTMQQ